MTFHATHQVRKINFEQDTREQCENCMLIDGEPGHDVPCDMQPNRNNMVLAKDADYLIKQLEATRRALTRIAILSSDGQIRDIANAALKGAV